MNKLSTVNVIEYVKGAIFSVKSFATNPEAITEAENLFSKLAKENGFQEDEIENGLEDGLCEQGEYQVFIVWSN